LILVLTNLPGIRVPEGFDIGFLRGFKDGNHRCRLGRKFPSTLALRKQSDAPLGARAGRKVNLEQAAQAVLKFKSLQNFTGF